LLKKFLLLTFAAIILSAPPVSAQQKYSVGIFPFVNEGTARYEWLSFGFEYLLSNKLSNISTLYVPDASIIKKSMQRENYSGGPVSGEMVYHVGKETGVSLAILAEYETNGNQIRVNLRFINAFTGGVILKKEYNNSLSDIFDIANDITANLISLSGVTVSEQESNIVNRRITNSVKAFENFSLGYLENEKSNGRPEVIIGLFRQAIREDDHFWEAYYNLGIVHYNAREYNKAEQQFDKIIVALPDFEKPYFGRGLIYLHREEYAKARSDFERVAELNPNDYKSYFYLGRVAAEQGDYVNSEKYFKKAQEINPDYPDLYYQMGNIFFDQNNYQKAIPHYKKAAELDPEHYSARKKLGECFYRTQVYYSAINEFEKVLEVQPQDAVANFMLGITVYKQAVLNELVEAFLELLDPEAAKSRNGNSLTTVRARDEVYRDMVRSFYRAQLYRPQFVEATFNLALTYHEMGKLDSASIYYQKTLQYQPNLVRAHIKIARLHEDLNEKELALAEYKRVIEIDPSYFVNRPTLGAIHGYINILNITLDELGEKLRDNPNDLRSNQTLAKIYFAQGYYGKAANIYRKILSINPNNKEARQMLAKLESKS
jgi:tetratricopeptide (TPR) repeat protein